MLHFEFPAKDNRQIVGNVVRFGVAYQHLTGDKEQNLLNSSTTGHNKRWPVWVQTTLLSTLVRTTHVTASYTLDSGVPFQYSNILTLIKLYRLYDTDFHLKYAWPILDYVPRCVCRLNV